MKNVTKNTNTAAKQAKRERQLAAANVLAEKTAAARAKKTTIISGQGAVDLKALRTGKKTTKNVEKLVDNFVAGAVKSSAKAAKGSPKAAPTKKAAADDALHIHVNPSGRLCFGKNAAARIGDLEFATVAFANGKLRIIAHAKQTDNSLCFGRANGRPYLSATKLLKEAGLFDGAAADLVAQPVNGHGFEIARG